MGVRYWEALCDQEILPSKRMNTLPRGVTFRVRGSSLPSLAELSEDLFVDTHLRVVSTFRLDVNVGMIHNERIGPHIDLMACLIVRNSRRTEREAQSS